MGITTDLRSAGRASGMVGNAVAHDHKPMTGAGPRMRTSAHASPCERGVPSTQDASGQQNSRSVIGSTRRQAQ